MKFTATLLPILQFFRKAVPNPTSKNLHVQVGVHFEEVCEMLEAIECTTPMGKQFLRDAHLSLSLLADYLKQNDNVMVISDRVAFMDAIADQIVTSTGSGYTAAMDIEGGINEVARSNLSKFDRDGNPIFNSHGKIMKGPDYSPPNLHPFV